MTVSLPLSLCALATMPLSSAQTRTGQRSNVPPTSTSTVVPRCAPAGKRFVAFGGAADADEARRKNITHVNTRLAAARGTFRAKRHGSAHHG